MANHGNTPRISHDEHGVLHGFFDAHLSEEGKPLAKLTSLNFSQDNDCKYEYYHALNMSVLDNLGIDGLSQHSVNQVHSKFVSVLNEGGEATDLGRVEADAMVTDQPHKALFIVTADCAPILFHGLKHNSTEPVIGAAHAGWRGAVSGVIENTVKAMIDCGADIETIVAHIGPCIDQESYQVKDDFRLQFLNTAAETEIFFKPSHDTGYYQFDLKGYCVWRLKNAGVHTISQSPIDTYRHLNFYSYRRATHQGRVEFGRNVSMIAIAPEFAA